MTSIRDVLPDKCDVGREILSRTFAKIALQEPFGPKAGWDEFEAHRKGCAECLLEERSSRLMREISKKTGMAGSEEEWVRWTLEKLEVKDVVD